jgi:hypothetical protein
MAQWAEGWTLIQEVIVPNYDVSVCFAQSIPQLRENYEIKSLVAPNFSCRGLQSENFGENFGIFPLRKAQLWKPISSDLFSFCSVYIKTGKLQNRFLLFWIIVDYILPIF